MAKSRAELESMLESLQQTLPALVAEYTDEGDFWNAFAGEAELIEDGAGSADIGYVRSRLDAMLAGQGLSPPSSGQSG